MAAKTWAAGSAAGADNLWSTAANWTGDTVPVAGDTVTINGTASSPNLTVDNVGTFNGSITVTSAYGGTVTQNVDITAGAAAAFSIAGGVWNQAAAFTCTTMGVTGGTWTGASQAMSLTGTLTFSGGSLTMTSGTCTIATGSFTQSGSVTFNANGGTIAFTSTSNATITGPNCTFNLITVSKGSSNFTIANGTTCPFGTDPSLTTGTFTVNGTATWSGAITLSLSISVASTGALTVSGTPAMSLPGNLTFTVGSTITSGIAVTFTGGSTVAVNASGYVFGTCVINRGGGTFTVVAGTVLPLGNNPAITFTGTMVVDGELSFTGTWSSASALTVGATGVISSLPLACTASLTINTGADVGVSGQSVTFSGTATTTITSPSYTLGVCTITKGSSTITVAAGTIVPIGTNPVASGNLTINGTVTASGAWSHTNGITMGATGVISGTTTLTISGQFNGNATATATGTTIVYNMPGLSSRTFAGGGMSIFAFTRTGGGTATLTITGTNTFGTFTDNLGLAAHTIIFPNVTTTVGDFIVAGSAGNLVTLSRTGAAGVFTLTKTGGGRIDNCDYLSISNSTVDVSPEWYAGANSVDVVGNTNWIFTAPPPIAKLRKSMFIVT